MSSSESISASQRTPERRARIERVLGRRQPDLTLILANIHDSHNVSAIYRSCDASGVGRVYLYYTNTPFPALGEKSSASARKWVESVRYADSGDMLRALRADNMQVLSTGFSEAAVPLRKWDFTRPTAVILGNEHSGVDKKLSSLADGELYIPMHGMIQSFNVSVAAAIILAEAVRQREAAGMYDAPRMDAASLAAQLETWLQK
ncbi:MAG: tRNA methyltransferase [Desulfovibrio sp.]|jgi:tRNA (guanosine-2'-O-)-methyltransferase|nr:tRNA methyltransferase [Desulfovibrio sp.]